MQLANKQFCVNSQEVLLLPVFRGLASFKDLTLQEDCCFFSLLLCSMLSDFLPALFLRFLCVIRLKTKQNLDYVYFPG